MVKPPSLRHQHWQKSENIETRRYRCGYCSEKVSSSRGFTYANEQGRRIALCPDCGCPTFFNSSDQWPGALGGESVSHVPADTNELYEEARRCMSSTSYTSAVLSCRKLLMHIAVEKGAKTNLSFKEYVDWLDSNGYTPNGSKDWVDIIRSKGNEANHEIVLMGQEDAEEIMIFSGMLLKFIYEFPNRIKKPTAAN